MCLLSYLPPGVMPDTTALLNGAVINDDGHGFAIVADGQLIVERGMHAEPLVAAFEVQRRRHPDGPALFHSRLCTHGQTSLDNCHPFPVGGDPRTVIAHNGVLPTVVQPGKGDPRSDTRIAAEEYLPAFGSLRTRRTRLAVQRWLTPSNKMVILTVDRRYKQPAYLLNEASGIWRDNIWYSNDGFLPLPDQRWSWPDDPNWDTPLWKDLRHRIDRCGLCQAIIDPLGTDCPYCGWCLDCGEMPEDCLCYPPAYLDRRAGRAGRR